MIFGRQCLGTYIENNQCSASSRGGFHWAVVLPKHSASSKAFSIPKLFSIRAPRLVVGRFESRHSRSPPSNSSKPFDSTTMHGQNWIRQKGEEDEGEERREVDREPLHRYATNERRQKIRMIQNDVDSRRRKRILVLKKGSVGGYGSSTCSIKVSWLDPYSSTAKLSIGRKKSR